MILHNQFFTIIIIIIILLCSAVFCRSVVCWAEHLQALALARDLFPSKCFQTDDLLEYAKGIFYGLE